MKNCCVKNSLIQELREARGLSRKQLHELSGVHEMTIWRIESFPDQQTKLCELRDIAKALNVPITDFIKDYPIVEGPADSPSEL